MFHHKKRACAERRFARDEFGGRMEGPGGGRHGWGRDRRMGRMFDHGDLRYIILQLIAEKPRHGYDIIKAIEDSLGGAYSPSPGVIYPTLTMLEEMGHASVEQASGNRKLYAITPEGQAFLEADRATLDAVRARMKHARDRHGSGPAPSILRAMENLKTALRMRFDRGPLADGDMQAIVAIIDGAARAVDQVKETTKDSNKESGA